MKVKWAASGVLNANGKSLEYQCFGPRPQDESTNDAPTLVMLHEGLGCNRLWRDFPVRLSEVTGCGVFTYSRAGYGQSDPVELPRPLDYMTREAVNVLPVVLQSIGAQTVVLVGHSDGATIAAVHAGSAPGTNVVGVVLIAPHFFTESFALQAIADTRTAYDHGDLRDRLGKYHRDPDNAFRGWSDSWLDPEFTNWNVEAILKNINVPVLAIQGREDPYGSLAQIDALVSGVAKAPVSRLILEKCQHAPHLEHESVVIDAISEFLRSLRATQSSFC